MLVVPGSSKCAKNLCLLTRKTYKKAEIFTYLEDPGIYTWNPKQPFINRCLVISNHFLCKDWVHHPIDSQPVINGWPWGSRYIYIYMYKKISPFQLNLVALWNATIKTSEHVGFWGPMVANIQ